MATPEIVPSDLALEVEEDLSPSEFMGAARHFFGLVDDVARHIKGDGEPVRWLVRVREGSTLLGAVAPSCEPQGVLNAIYGKICAAVDLLASGAVEETGLSETALKHLRGLSALTDSRKDRPVEVRIWVQRRAKLIGPEIHRFLDDEWRVDYNDFGTIEGRLEAIQGKDRLQIGVNDPLFRQNVRCYMTEDLLALALSSFRKRVEVSGTIHYRRDGTPVSIDASSICALPDDSELPTANDVRGILSGLAH